MESGKRLKIALNQLDPPSRMSRLPKGSNRELNNGDHEEKGTAMTDHQTTSSQARSRSFASGTPQPGPAWGLAVAAIMLIVAASEYVVTEGILA